MENSNIHHCDTSGLDHDSGVQGDSTPGQELNQRSRLHRGALGIAERGKPVFPCKPDKSPHYIRGILEHGALDATTDPAKVNAFWNAKPGASLGVPTGRESGFWVLDVDLDPARGIDGYLALDDLEKEHGKLPGTCTVRTPRGGQHRYFTLPEGVEITNSPGGLPKGLDVRGQGGYVLVPPSPGYKIESKASIEEAPEWLLKLILSRRRDGGEQVRKGRPRAQAVPPGGPIPEGERNSRLFFWALDRKDEGRSREEVLALVLTENDARCNPPLEQVEVQAVVKSAMRYPIRAGTPTPELIEACDRLDEDWWRRLWKGRGGGGHTDRDVKRVLIDLARRYGRLLPDGSVEVSASVRSVALAAATSYVTVSGGATKRLARCGQIVKLDNERARTEAATWRLLPPPVQPFNTQHSSYYIKKPMLCVKGLRPISKRVWDLETPAFRRYGHVGKGAAGVMYHVEARGHLTFEGIAEALSISPGDLRRRGYVDRLLAQENPLLELRDDGAYVLPEDHRARVEEVRKAPYSTVRLIRRRTYSPDEGRYVTTVHEVGRVASEVQREKTEEEAHEKHQETWHRQLAELKEMDGICFEDLPPFVVPATEAVA